MWHSFNPWTYDLQWFWYRKRFESNGWITIRERAHHNVGGDGVTKGRNSASADCEERGCQYWTASCWTLRLYCASSVVTDFCETNFYVKSFESVSVCFRCWVHWTVKWEHQLQAFDNKLSQCNVQLIQGEPKTRNRAQICTPNWQRALILPRS